LRSRPGTLTAAALVLGAFSAAPAADDKKLTPQPEKMKACNTQAADKKGDERKGLHVGVSEGWRARRADDSAGQDEGLQYQGWGQER
jgi:hypothetical protein